MQQLMAWLTQNRYNVPEIHLDGTVKRFGRDGKKDNGWFIGWQNHSIKTGIPYIIAQVGDWRTGECLTYRPEGKLAREDNEAIKKILDSARKKAEETKKQAQLEVAALGEKLWGTFGTTGDSPYLARKKIDKLYGCRTKPNDAGNSIIVPQRDVTGFYWGHQTIYANGDKRFMAGGRVSGTFHLIGDLDETVIVCEGYATGASIHMATGFSVACAFNAGNLSAVAKAIKARNPDIQIIIAGDDDRGVEGNPGRTKAEKAAVECGGSAIIASFPPDDNGTDFNDIHVTRGLDAVKEYFVRPAETSTGFVPIGYSKSTCYFFSHESKEVRELTTFTDTQLFLLAPKDYWYAMYPSKNGCDWQAVKDALIRKCVAAGPFDATRIRGTGVWYDKGRVIINSGRDLLVDGKPTSPALLKSWHVYQQTSNRFPTPSTNGLAVEECKLLTDACEALNWEDPKSGYFLGGWLALARIAGALPIRPHIWLTGSAGSGKSTVMEQLISNALGGKKGKIYAQGNTTEAGIRQTVGSSSLPLIFDEFETNDERSKDRITSIVQLLRQAWSQSDGYILKGSMNGNASHYALGFSALVSSIRVNLDNDADRSRFALCELRSNNNDPARWKIIKGLLNKITEEYGERLFARSTKNVKTILRSYEVLQEAFAGKLTQRMGQQYGMLMAGYWSLRSDEPITVEIAMKLVEEIDLFEEHEEARGSCDEQECLNHLLTKRITLQNHDATNIERSIGEAILDKRYEIYEALKRYGIIVENEWIYIANSHTELAKIYERTRWVRWGMSLKRLPNAKTDRRRWFGQELSRCVAIQMSYVMGKNSVSP